MVIFAIVVFVALMFAFPPLIPIIASLISILLLTGLAGFVLPNMTIPIIIGLVTGCVLICLAYWPQMKQFFRVLTERTAAPSEQRAKRKAPTNEAQARTSAQRAKQRAVFDAYEPIAKDISKSPTGMFAVWNDDKSTIREFENLSEAREHLKGIFSHPRKTKKR